MESYYKSKKIEIRKNIDFFFKGGLFVLAKID